MKRLLFYSLFFVLILFVIWIYEHANHVVHQAPVFKEINNQVRSVSVSNDSVFIRFNSDYFDSVYISSEVTMSSNKDHRYIFSNVLPVKNKVIKIPVKQMVGYDGEQYSPEKIQLIKFQLGAFDSIFQKYQGRYSYSTAYYKTTYNHHELWYFDSLDHFKSGPVIGNTFFVKE